MQVLANTWVVREMSYPNVMICPQDSWKRSWQRHFELIDQLVELSD